MSKKILLALFLVVFAFSTNSQTRVGVFGGLSSIIPAQFSYSSQSLIVTRVNNDQSEWRALIDTFDIYNTDFQMIKRLVVERPIVGGYSGQRGLAVVVYCYGEMNYLGEMESLFLPTQTLFNNDANFEYIIPSSDGAQFIDEYTCKLVKYDVRSENGSILFSINADAGYYFCDGEDNISWVYFLNLSGHQFLTIEERSETDNDDTKYVVYRIDRQTESIQRVTELPFNVYPTLVDRGQEITIELGEGNNATEISVFDANGRILETIPVQAGQREVKVPASTMGHGLKLLNARDRQRQTTRKIIVK